MEFQVFPLRCPPQNSRSENLFVLTIYYTWVCCSHVVGWIIQIKYHRKKIIGDKVVVKTKRRGRRTRTVELVLLYECVCMYVFGRKYWKPNFSNIEESILMSSWLSFVVGSMVRLYDAHKGNYVTCYTILGGVQLTNH